MISETNTKAVAVHLRRFTVDIATHPIVGGDEVYTLQSATATVMLRGEPRVSGAGDSEMKVVLNRDEAEALRGILSLVVSRISAEANR